MVFGKLCLTKGPCNIIARLDASMDRILQVLLSSAAPMNGSGVGVSKKQAWPKPKGTFRHVPRFGGFSVFHNQFGREAELCHHRGVIGSVSKVQLDSGRTMQC